MGAAEVQENVTPISWTSIGTSRRSKPRRRLEAAAAWDRRQNGCCARLDDPEQPSASSIAAPVSRRDIRAAKRADEAEVDH